MKKAVKNLIFFLCIFCFQFCADASFLKNIEDGISLYEKGYFDNAREYFENYIINNPNDEDGYYWLAKTFSKISKDDDTLSNKNFKKAYEIILKKRNIEKAYFNSDENVNLEDYFDIATTYFEAGRYDKSDKYADLMLKIDPQSALAYFVKAKVAYTKGENEKAKEHLEHAIMHNNEIIKTNLAAMLEIKQVPDTSKDVYYYRAIEKFFEGNLKETKNNIEKYTELDNQNVEMKNFLVDLAFKTGDIALAQKTVDEVFNANPKNIQNYVNQTKIYKFNGEQEKIESILNKAAKINPNNKELLQGYANYYLDKKDYENSKKYFENLIFVDDKYYEAYFGYIYSLIQLKDFDNAVVWVRKASALNPSTSEIPYLLAQICILNAQYDEALGYINDAIKKEQNPNYYFELAKLNYILEKYPAAIINLNDAIELSDSDAKSKEEMYEYLAKCYFKIQDIKSVKKLTTDKNKLDKNKIMYKYILYKLCKLESNEKEASFYFLQLKKAKPSTEADYINLSEFYFEEFGIDSATKFLEEGEKRFPNSASLYSQKLKLHYFADNKEKLTK